MTEKKLCFVCDNEIGFSYYVLDYGYLCHECGKELINQYLVSDTKLNEKQVINDCEHCYHFNPLIWDEGEFYQCMLHNKLWVKCDDFEVVQ